MNTPANDELPDELIDTAYEAMSAELDHWNIVGPLTERRAPPLPPREFWNAVRKNNAAIEEQPRPTIFHLKDRPTAIACVQWHGLKAAITAVKGELV